MTHLHKITIAHTYINFNVHSVHLYTQYTMTHLHKVIIVHTYINFKVLCVHLYTQYTLYTSTNLVDKKRTPLGTVHMVNTYKQYIGYSPMYSTGKYLHTFTKYTLNTPTRNTQCLH